MVREKTINSGIANKPKSKEKYKKEEGLKDPKRDKKDGKTSI